MKKVDLTMLGYCGIYCPRCDIYEACKSGDTEKQREIADWINKHFHADCTPQQIRCSGCKGPLDEHWSVACKVRVCASKRGVVTCVDCDEYGACETLESFYRGGEYESARATLKRIGEIGLDAWAAEQEK
jgi:hypothetical protein